MNSLKAQAVLALCVFMLLVVGGSSFFYFLFAVDYYIEQKKETMEESYWQLQSVDLSQEALEEDEVIQALEDESFSVIICDENMQAVYASKVSGRNNLIQTYIAGHTEDYTVYAHAVYERDIARKPIVLKGLIRQENRNYYVYLYENTTVIRRSVTYVNEFLRGVVVIAMLLGIVFAWVLSKAIVGPVERIRSITGKIAEGDYSARLEKPMPNKELEELRQSINRMTDRIDLPRREELRIEVKGYYRPTLYDAMTGEIREVSCTHKDGRTRILETVYDHDSLLYALDEAPAPDRREERSTAEAPARIQREERSPAEASAQNRREEGALPEKEASAPVQTAKDSGIKLPDYVPFCLEEPNVCVLDMAKSSLDGMEWEAPEEILRIDNAYRKKLGYPLRQEAFPQPWLMPEEDCGSHRISLRFTIRSEIPIDHPVLALEQAAQTRLTLNGEAVSPEITGYYVDRSIQTVALPGLRAGENILIQETP